MMSYHHRTDRPVLTVVEAETALRYAEADLAYQDTFLKNRRDSKGFPIWTPPTDPEIAKRRDLERKVSRAKHEIERAQAQVAQVRSATEEIESKVVLFDYGTPSPDIAWTIDGIFARGSVNMLVAVGSSLKTWLLYSMANAVASGRPWLGEAGYPVDEGAVLVLDYESGEEEAKRMFGILRKNGEPTPHYLWQYGPLAEEATWKALQTYIRAKCIKLVIIDSLTACHPDADQNDTRFSKPLQLAGIAAEATGATFAFIHHAKKNHSGSGDDMVRGTSALHAACDAIYTNKNVTWVGGTDKVSTCTFSVIKPGKGQKPEPIRLRLSDSGGLQRDIAPVANGLSTLMSAGEIENEILRKIQSTYLTEQELIGSGQVKGQVVKGALKALVEQGKIRKTGHGKYMPDSDEARMSRIARVLYERSTAKG